MEDGSKSPSLIDLYFKGVHYSFARDRRQWLCLLPFVGGLLLIGNFQDSILFYVGVGVIILSIIAYIAVWLFFEVKWFKINRQMVHSLMDKIYKKKTSED